MEWLIICQNIQINYAIWDLITYNAWHVCFSKSNLRKVIYYSRDKLQWKVGGQFFVMYSYNR